MACDLRLGESPSQVIPSTLMQHVLSIAYKPQLVILLALLLAALAFLQYRHGQVKKRLPPGPRPSIWGTTRLPSQHPWRTLREYTDTYGDLITIQQSLNRYLFVCGNATTAQAILQRQSSASRDRPHLIMAGDFISGGKRILVIGAGERWRKYRKIMHEALNNTKASSYQSIQQKEAALTVLAIGQRPDTFQRQFSRYAASVVMTLTYDLPVKDLDDARVARVAACLLELGKWINPSASPLDSWPLLRFVPEWCNPWKKLGMELHKKELALFLETYIDVRERINKGTAQPCFASQLQEKQEVLGLSDEEACYVAGSLFGAGSDTTASALSIFVMAMIKHPRVVKKAQRELDRVTGTQRLPTFDDQADLPYLCALCQEVSRWRPVSSGGFQHALTEDIHYNGYTLPKGSAIVGNHWSIHLDAREYPNPDEFYPERFLDEGEETVHGTWFSTKGHYQFGFGRRVCVGSNVAERSIFINAAMLLWAFDIQAPNGRPEDVDTLAFTSTANSHPLPFEAVISYRSLERKKTVEQECAAHRA